uniref:Uncharacterized protein n=1 Tax=uncultured marine virus TaxID=186617 RepID=A0A0F7L7Z4_9VIRU|nr:hypothetical protein [uncultured marine virus]
MLNFNFPNINSVRAALVPFKTDLLTWHKKIVGNVFNEKINTPALDGAVIGGKVAVFDGSNYLKMPIKLPNNTDSFFIECRTNGVNTSPSVEEYLFGCYYSYSVSQIYIHNPTNFQRLGLRMVDSDGVTLNKSIENVANCDKIVLNVDRVSNKVTVHINNVEAVNENVTFTGTFYNANADQINIGARNLGANKMIGNYEYFNFNDEYIYYLNNLYDSISGGTLTNYGVTFEDTASFTPQSTTIGLTVGYYELSTGEQVVNPQFALPVGATAIDGGTDHNMISSFIDFDPTASTDAKLDNFDRSNATIFNNTARAGADYDSSNPYRFHVDNITDPLVYCMFFNVGYKGKIFAKIIAALTGLVYKPTLYKEELNYSTDKKGDDEYKVMKYCGIGGYAFLDANNEPITDANGYVIII